MLDILCSSYPHGCPCGFYGDPIKECSCSASSIARYQKRISGPLLDRIDIHIEVPRVLRVDYEKLADKRQVENSATIRTRVQTARELQLQRFTDTKLTCNAEIGPSEVRDFCNVEPSAEKLLKTAMQQLHLSARAFHRVLKLARAIADLASSDMIAANHVAEAIQYRPRVGGNAEWLKLNWSCSIYNTVTSSDSTYERIVPDGVLEIELLGSKSKIAQTSPYATGSCFDNGVGQMILSLLPGASVIIYHAGDDS